MDKLADAIEEDLCSSFHMYCLGYPRDETTVPDLQLSDLESCVTRGQPTPREADVSYSHHYYGERGIRCDVVVSDSET